MSSRPRMTNDSGLNTNLQRKHSSRVLLQLTVPIESKATLALIVARGIDNRWTTLALRKISPNDWLSEPAWKVSANWLERWEQSITGVLLQDRPKAPHARSESFKILINQHHFDIDPRLGIKVGREKSSSIFLANEETLPFQILGEPQGLLITNVPSHFGV